MELGCLLKLPWLVKTLDDGDSHKFSASLEEILSFPNFEILETGKLPKRWRCAFPRGTKMRNGLHFWIHSDAHMHSKYFKSFWGRNGPPKGQKTP